MSYEDKIDEMFNEMMDQYDDEDRATREEPELYNPRWLVRYINGMYPSKNNSQDDNANGMVIREKDYAGKVMGHAYMVGSMDHEKGNDSLSHRKPTVYMITRTIEGFKDEVVTYFQYVPEKEDMKYSEYIMEQAEAVKHLLKTIFGEDCYIEHGIDPCVSFTPIFRWYIENNCVKHSVLWRMVEEKEQYSIWEEEGYDSFITTEQNVALSYVNFMRQSGLLDKESHNNLVSSIHRYDREEEKYKREKTRGRY